MANWSSKRLILPWERQWPWTFRTRILRLGGPVWFGLFVAVLVFGIWKKISADEKERITRITIQQIERENEIFFAREGRCPKNLKELTEFARAEGRWTAQEMVDGWGRAFWFQCPARWDAFGVKVVSAGPEESFWDEDNIDN